MTNLPPDDYPRGATRLLLAMSRSSAGWSESHLDRLLTGFGFVKRDSGAHTFYRHASPPELALAVPRSRRLRPYVVADAVRIVGRLLATTAEESE
jgi:hypothetical protein